MSDLRIEPLGLHLDLVDTTVRWHLDEFDPGGDVAWWTLARRAEARLDGIPCAWVAFLDENAVGTVSLIEHNMDAKPEFTPWLAALYVLPEFRAQGIGTALVRRCEQEAAATGKRSMYLYTSIEAFYERLGWTVRSREPYEGKTVVVMERTLD
jgi:predicted N-acetyltransferase YhbS